MPARTRTRAVLSTPSFIAMASAVLNPRPRMSRARREGFSDTGLRHKLGGIGAVGLVDAHRPRRAHTVAMQEDHDLADHLLLGPGGDDATGPYWTDAIHFPEAVRLCLDDVKYLVAEGVQQLLGIGRANAADH